MSHLPADRPVRALPIAGVATASRGNLVGERLRLAKREAVEAALGKGESWATKVINGESGVRVDDLPALLDFLGLQVVPAGNVCVDPELLHAVEAIARKAMAGRSLFAGDE